MLAAVVTVGAATGLAQTKAFDYHAGAELQAKQKEMIAKAVASGAGNVRIAEYGDHQVTTAARTQSGGPEVHEHWADVILVTEGRATMVIGGTVVKPTPRAEAGPGEMGGTDIDGGTTQVLEKGDLINIPAGTPHWIKIAPGERFAYLNVKVRRQE